MTSMESSLIFLKFGHLKQEKGASAQPVRAIKKIVFRDSSSN